MSSKHQTIFRTLNPGAEFTIISNKLCKHVGLSMATKGFLTTILALPHDWSFKPQWFMGQYNIGRNETYRCINEAIEHGFCQKISLRDASGRLTGALEYVFASDPEVLSREVANRFPTCREDGEPNRHTDIPACGKPALLENKDLEQRKDNTPLPPKGGGGEIAGASEKPKRARRELSDLPQDWEPSGDLKGWSLNRNPAHSAIFATEVEKFRGHWHGTGKRMKDWDATWRKWWATACERPAPKSKFGAMPSGRVSLSTVAKPGMNREQVFRARDRAEDDLDKPLRAPLWGRPTEEAVLYRADTPEFNARITQLIRDGEIDEAEKLQQRGKFWEYPSKMAGSLVRDVVSRASAQA